MGDLGHFVCLAAIVVIAQEYRFAFSDIVQQFLRRRGEHHFDIGLAGRIAIHRCADRRRHLPDSCRSHICETIPRPTVCGQMPFSHRASLPVTRVGAAREKMKC